MDVADMCGFNPIYSSEIILTSLFLILYINVCDGCPRYQFDDGSGECQPCSTLCDSSDVFTVDNCQRLCSDWLENEAMTKELANGLWWRHFTIALVLGCVFLSLAVLVGFVIYKNRPRPKLSVEEALDTGSTPGSSGVGSSGDPDTASGPTPWSAHPEDNTRLI